MTLAFASIIVGCVALDLAVKAVDAAHERCAGWAALYALGSIGLVQLTIDTWSFSA